MDQPDVPDLEELSRTRRDALEAALREMVNSGFGDLDAQVAQAPQPTSPPAAASSLNWW